VQQIKEKTYPYETDTFIAQQIQKIDDAMAENFVVCVLVIVLSVFWSLCCFSFGHCVVCVLVIVLSVFWPLCCPSFGHCVVCVLVIVLSGQHNDQNTDNTVTKTQTTQ
jgi:hypothetical protein